MAASSYEEQGKIVVVEPSRHRIVRKQAAVAEAVRRALDVVDRAEPGPSVEDLWRESSICAGRPLYKRHGLKTFAAEQAIRELDEDLQRALLVPFCTRWKFKLDPATRVLLAETLEWYVAAVAPYGEWGAPDWTGRYEAAYRSPREVELDAIAHDRRRSYMERESAIDQI
jgi:hypothetical protein